MALTDTQKMTLDRLLTAKFNAYPMGETIIPIDSFNTEDMEYSITSLLASIKRISDGSFSATYNKFSKTIVYFRGKTINRSVDTFKKDKNLLYLDCCDGLIYDFSTKKFNMDLNTVNGAVDYFKNFNNVFEYEWLFNYVKNMNELYYINKHVPKEVYRTMPNGFYQVIQEKGFSAELLVEYFYRKKYGKYYWVAKTLGDYSCQEIFTGTALERFISDVSFDNYIKIIKNDIINCGFSCLNQFGYCRDFIMLYNTIKEAHPDFALDFDRDSQKNKELMEAIRDSEKNEILAKQLQKLNFINGLQIGEYTIVVPQNQDEKQDEGKQQNNCVGYYYDNSIINGDNLIYFIRKTADVHHSYITCRYNIASRITAEYRKVNNKPVVDNTEVHLISDIDEIIRKELA